MNYKETLDYLFNSTPVFEHVGASAYKEGLYNTLALDEHFGHPHKNFKTIHIAGTNGKGSCSHSLAAMLQLKGYKVGLYTSPHIVDFRERIRVNGQCVSEDYVIDFVEKERYFFEPLHPSFFELTTAMAFKYFADQHIDIAVIEVGLGGRLDCTNIINPLLSYFLLLSYLPLLSISYYLNLPLLSISYYLIFLFPVHFFVIALIISASYFFHPRLVIQVPFDSLHNADFEFRFGIPT